MKEYYKIINNDAHSESEKQPEGTNQLTLFEQLANKMQKELINAQDVDLDYVEMMKNLERELPKMPPEPKV